MKRVTLSLKDIRDKKELHEAIKTAMNPPEWYGNNLDALFDTLTDLSEDTFLVISDTENFQDMDEKYYKNFIRVLTDASKENTHFTYELTEKEETKKMKVFVTGGTGNIGQNITLELLKRGHEVVLLTRTPSRIPAFLEMEGVTVVEGNILDFETMAKAMEGCDSVIHIALGWGNTPVKMLQHDTLVTCFLMQKAEELQMKSIIYTSSTAAMGPLRDGMDETALLIPGDLYGSTKASTEMYLLGFNQYYDGQGVYGKKVSLKRNVIRPGYTFSNPRVENGASESDTRFEKICLDILDNKDLTFESSNGTQFLAGDQIAVLYADLLESDLDKEIFLALGNTFISWGQIALWAKEMIPESTSKITIIEDGKKPSYYGVHKMEEVFGLSFDGTEKLKEHVKWNVERARKIHNGEEVHNVYHVW